LIRQRLLRQASFISQRQNQLFAVRFRISRPRISHFKDATKKDIERNIPMPTSKRRRESAWKSRKQSHQPHGKVPSLHGLANDADPEGKPDPTKA